jgi:orotate phosphoribosyltransferase
MSDSTHATNERFTALLLAAGALERGHFVLQSGHHSDQRLGMMSLLEQRSAVTEIAEALAAQSGTLVGAMGGDIDLVVGATAGDSVLAEEVGRALGVRSIVASDGFGAATPPRARVLLIADDLETGAPIQLLLPALYAAGAHPIAAAVVVRRTAELTEIEAEGRDPIPLIAGITLNLSTYEPADCPLCAAGEPIGTPGSSVR